MDEFGRKLFKIDFFGNCEILAESEDEAMSMFWQMVDTEQPLPHNWYFVDEVAEMENLD